MKKIIKNIWNRLNGNKTIISQLLAILALLVQDIFEPAFFNKIIAIIGVFAGASFVHHVKKGSFSKFTK